MSEVDKIMDRCASRFYLIYSSIDESEWGKKDIAQNYLSKYWIDQFEYEGKWKAIQDRIFINQDKGLPEMVFKDDFKLLTMRGGVLFEKADFLDLQACLLEIGEKSFVVIENTFGKSNGVPLRMKYPTNITWEELMSGNFISSVLFESSINEYFVFGQTGMWGKYTANDYEKPLDIIGFNPDYSSVFQRHFQQSNEEWEEVREWLPPNYKNRIGHY